MGEFQEKEFKKRIDMNTWKEIYKYTINVRKTFVLVTAMMIFLALGDTIFPMFSKYAIDNYVIGGNVERVIEITIPFTNSIIEVVDIYLFTIIFVVVMLLQCYFVFVFIKCAGIMEGRIQHDMKEAAFLKLQELPFSYYDKTPAGWIIARLTSDSKRIGSVIAWVLIDFVWSTAVIIAMLVAMFMLNVKLALVVTALMPFLSIIGYYFQVKILKGHREVSKINSKATAGYSEGIAGAKTTKTLVREEGSLQEFKKVTTELKVKSIRVQIFSTLFMAVVAFVGTVGTALVLNVGSVDVLGGNVTIGTLAVFLSYVTLIFEPIRNIARAFSEVQSAQASGERVISLINEELEIKDTPEVLEKYGDFFNPKVENYEDFVGDIEFKDVTFKYKDGDKVLQNFNLKINAGEKIALVGETGGGKSTIINLISRFYEPTEGEILFDGVDYRQRSQGWLHSKLSYVLQSPHLFAGTIKENILYGKIDGTDEEVIEACKKVNAYDFIEGFENGLNTDVGEGGSRLSQGEKQLVSFARAIIGSPRLFILDEATSSIDTITESKIQNAIDTALDGRTSFIVAHRLSTIKNADRILYISKGQVLEDGNHKELMKKRGNYYNLYMKQFKEEASLNVLK